MKLRGKSPRVSLTGLFAALHVTLYFFPYPLFRNWVIFLEPIEGIILGPWAGFSAALIGSVIARMIKPDVFWMFGIFAEPIGVLACGFLSKGKWKPVMGIYSIMLGAYFIHPFGRWLPLWAIVDIMVAFIFIYPVSQLSKLIKGNLKQTSISVVLISFVCTATDSLARVFLLVPVGLYTFFGMTQDILYITFIEGAVGSYIEDMLVVLVSSLINVPLVIKLRNFSKEYSLA